MRSLFVDCHSHVVPSGDDGAGGVGEGAALCREAAGHGTRLLFATPHVWPHLPLTEAREEEIRHSFEHVRAAAGLELRLGWELTPAPPLLEEDPNRYRLEGTDSLGRDMLIRVLYGSRISLTVGVAAVFAAVLIGVVIGLYAARHRE